MQLRITKPLAELQSDAYNEVTAKLYKHITETSDFPEWKQINYSDTSSDYRINAIGKPLSAPEQAKLDYITSVRGWKDALLAERDRVKGEIFASSSMVEIIVAKGSMNYTQIPTEPL